MDDLIVIILTLVIAAFGALGQLKKKKRGPESEGENESGGTFWDMLQEEQEYDGQGMRQEFDIPEFVPERREQASDPEVITEKKEAKEKYKFYEKSEGISAVPKAKKGRIPGRIKKRSGIRERFSLRDAVIYSEILNRKYSD